MPTFEAGRPGLLWDATAVPNAFFCEYMPSAPESHVKVYLYGLMCAHSGVWDEMDMLDEVAQALHIDRTEVERALRYWERCRLVERVQDTPARYRFASVQQVLIQREQMPRDDAYESFAQAVYSAFGDRRKLHGGETVLAYEWVEQFRLPPEVVLMLIQHMIATRGVNFSFKEAQKVAVELCEQKVSTIEQAEMIFSRSAAAMKGTRKILNHLGMRRNPSMDEMDLYLKWTEEWGFDPKAIKEACKETTKGAPTFAYLDKVLEGIHIRTGGKATSGEQVQTVLTDEKNETARIRELLQTLGISMASIGDGMRAEYRSLVDFGGHDLVVLAATRLKNKDLISLRKYLERCKEKGLVTAELLQKHIDEQNFLNKEIRGLKDKAGGSYTQVNQERLTKWKQEWHMSEELIQLSAELSYGKKEPLAYMDKLLSDWHSKNIANVADARAEHEKHTSQPKLSDKPSVGGGKRVIEQQYEQRHYDISDYDDIPDYILEEMKKA